MIMCKDMILFFEVFTLEIKKDHIDISNIPELSITNKDIENRFVSHDDFKEKIIENAKNLALLYLIIKKISDFEIKFQNFNYEYYKRENTLSDKIKLIQSINEYIVPF